MTFGANTVQDITCSVSWFENVDGLMCSLLKFELLSSVFLRQPFPDKSL